MRTLITIILLVAFSFTTKAAINFSVEQYGCSNQLAVYVTATTAYLTPPANRWQSSIFAVMWQSSYGNTVVSAVTGQNGFNYNLSGAVQTWGGGTHYYQAFSFSALNYTFNMAIGAKTLVAIIDLNGDIFADVKIPESTISGGTGNPPKSTFTNTANQHPTTYPAKWVYGVNLFPGVFFDASGWCGGTGAAGAPGAGDINKRCYVETAGAVIAADAQVKSLNVKPGATLSIDSFFDIFMEINLEDNGSTPGYMTINPGGSVTAGGTTTLAVPSQLKILADATGVGSFIDNGTVVHGAGSADVQIWVNNVAAAGNFHWHLVGPTVQDPTYTGAGVGGVYLGAFALPISTYAYNFNQAAGTWQNIYELTDAVPTASGIALSTAENAAYTLNMTGHLATGPISSLPTAGASGLALLSNPYASAVDFNTLYSTNAGVITNKRYEWIHSAGDYGVWTVGSGGTNGVTKDIQVGQGFFVESASGAPVNFTYPARVHSDGNFHKDSYANRLVVRTEGNNFSDESIIHFYEGAEFGYNELQDAYKWSSMYAEATEIWTVANDQSLLSVNALPSLGNGMVSVPVSFKCGVEGTYTISALEAASFESGTEIYLEDLATGAAWVDLVTNPVYTFDATPNDEQGRFIIHFFGPTGIGENENSMVKIYGWGQDAYIVNRGNETISEYVAYDLMGRELHRGTLPNNTVNKVQIGDVSAYYIVKAITKEGRIYTDKVYITK